MILTHTLFFKTTLSTFRKFVSTTALIMQGSADGSTRKKDSHRLIYKDLGIQPGTGPLLPGVREPLIETFLIITYLALLSARDRAVATLFLCFPSGNVF